MELNKQKTIFFSIFLISYLLLIQGVNNSKKLVFLTEVSRHGARSPMYDVINASSQWKNFYPKSQLTQVGMRQHYLLGRQIRKTYARQYDLFSTTFNSSQIYIHTTETARTQMSAQSQMYGLFFEQGQNMPFSWKFQAATDLPPMPIDNGELLIEEIGQKNLPNSFQPVPTFGPVDPHDDPVMNPASDCPKISVIKAAANQSQITKDFYTYLEKKGILNRFRQLFSIQSDQSITIDLIGQYYDTLVCNQYQQIPFPPQLSQEDWEWIQFIYHFQQLYLNFSNNQTKLLQATNFLKDMIYQMEGALMGEELTGKKFQYYSGSDNNINILNVIFGVVSYTTDFDVWKQNQIRHSNPSFASTVFFEVFEDQEGQLSVVYKYNGQDYNICGNNDTCSFQQFKELTNKWTISFEEYEQQCDEDGQHELVI